MVTWVATQHVAVAPDEDGRYGPIIDGMAVRVSSPILIGRSVEVERLQAGLELARAGRSSATLVAGEAGAGKTRLVSRFRGGRPRVERAVVLLGGCIDLGEGASPYAPVVEALRGLAQASDSRGAGDDPRPGTLGAGAGSSRTWVRRRRQRRPPTGPDRA